jgi:hypothetical protein
VTVLGGKAVLYEKSRIAVFGLMLLCPASATNAQSSSEDLDLSLPPVASFGDERSNQELDIGYDSKPVGSQKQWRLDSGDIEDDSLAARLRLRQGDGPLDRYSGIRLRVPLGETP